LSAFLFILGVYIPIIGIAIAFTSPVPISLIGVRQGAYRAFIAVLFVAISVFLPFGIAGSLSFVFWGAGFFGIVFGIVIKKTKTAGEAVLGLLITALVAKVVFIGLMINIKGYNPFMIDENALGSLIKSLGTSGAPDDVIQSVVKSISLSIPSFLIMISALDSYVNYYLVSLLENRRQSKRCDSNIETNELKILPLPPFEQWSFPRSLLLAFFLAFIIPLFDASNSSSVIISAELNLKILTVTLFFIQGLSFLWWWMLFKKFSYGIRLSIIFVLFFVPILSMGFIIIGVIDISLNLRERIRRNNK
jgi:uncharacterized protein YybS (DUF2232 family)